MTHTIQCNSINNIQSRSTVRHNADNQVIIPEIEMESDKIQFKWVLGDDELKFDFNSM